MSSSQGVAMIAMVVLLTVQHVIYGRYHFDPLVIMIGEVLVPACGVLAIALTKREIDVPSGNSRLVFVGAMLAMTAGVYCMGYLYRYGIDSGKVTMCIAIVPVFALCLNVLLDGNIPSWKELGGFTLAFGAIVLFLMDSKPTVTTPPIVHVEQTVSPPIAQRELFTEESLLN